MITDFIVLFFFIVIGLPTTYLTAEHLSNLWRQK